MTKIELSAFSKTLHRQQSELGAGKQNREALTLETSPDELDRIQHASDRDYAIGNLERNSGRLREVRSALRRIDAGSFGICVECDTNISLKRLAAVPWASSCITCQEALDRGQEMRSEVDASMLLAA
jgi:DnaK suppressor protein